MSTLFTSPRGDMWFIEQALTVEAAEYASGDLVGGKIALEDILTHRDSPTKRSAGGIIQSVIITDKASQNIAKDVVFFDADPENTTFTENAAFDPADADIANIIGAADVSDWKSFNDNSFGQAQNLAMPFVLSGSGALYAVIVERGAPTYASTSDLTLRVGILPA